MKDLFSAPCFAVSGSRSPSQKAIASLKKVLSLVPSAAPVSVGCADGVDQLVRSFFAGSQSLRVFSVASGRYGVGRSAFARRSADCMASVCPDGLVVALPSSPVCPSGVKVQKGFYGAGSGTWGSVAYVLAHGGKVLLWLEGGRPPVWSSVSSSSLGSGWWLLSPAPVASQLSLF